MKNIFKRKREQAKMNTIDNSLEEKTRDNILLKIKDLQHKIETNEACPDGGQDITLLHHVGDCLEECLNNWNY